MNILPLGLENTSVTIRRYNPYVNFGELQSEETTNSAWITSIGDTMSISIRGLTPRINDEDLKFRKDKGQYCHDRLKTSFEFFKLLPALFLIHGVIEIDDFTILHTVTLFKRSVPEDIYCLSLPETSLIRSLFRGAL